MTEFAGRTVVLFFYPRDLTPGCTQEACAFRDAETQLMASGVAVVGVSPDSVTSHGKFAALHGLRDPLLADTDRAICQSYGVWVEKSMYGRKYMGVERSTFVIGPDGILTHLFRKVKPAKHVAEVARLLSPKHL